MKNFKCSGEDNEHIPLEILELGIRFPEAYSEKKSMIKLSKEFKTYRKDNIYFLPFCLTILPEAFGAQINLGDEKYLPRVKEYAINSLEDIDDLKEIDFQSGRVKQVLDAIEELKKESNYVALKVEGPFTVITSIMDPRIFYKLLRKDRDKALDIINKVEKGILEYIDKAIERGVDIISYGDSSGVESIVGKNVYRDFSGISTLNVVKEFSRCNYKGILHLCGLTSLSLYNNGFIELVPIRYDENLTYGQGLINIMKDKNHPKVLGGQCIKNTNRLLKESLAYKVVLKI
ncbi:uroporphyrinogen decarboxylase family protein [Clostridium sp.]|uniref:uroporphyrinogen decarboxylase family protein n=1 Tax=Clostridium sp. TaxID=1506 RepID=UPI003464E2AE